MMTKIYNYYDGILSRLYKKEQNDRLKLRIKNIKPIVNSKSPGSYNFFRQKFNKTNGNEDISKKKKI